MNSCERFESTAQSVEERTAQAKREQAESGIELRELQRAAGLSLKEYADHRRAEYFEKLAAGELSTFEVRAPFVSQPVVRASAICTVLVLVLLLVVGVLLLLLVVVVVVVALNSSIQRARPAGRNRIRTAGSRRHARCTGRQRGSSGLWRRCSRISGALSLMSSRQPRARTTTWASFARRSWTCSKGEGGEKVGRVAADKRSARSSLTRRRWIL